MPSQSSMNRVALLALAFNVLSLSAQDSRFESRSRLVLLPVTVTDAQGRSVDGLEAADFAVLDNGHPRPAAVDTIGTGVAPIALTIAIQSSSLSAAVLEKVRKIAGMVQPLITGERGCAALLSFADRMTWLQECTNDPDALEAAFKRLRPSIDKEGRVLDAANAAIARLSERPNARRVLLLISESRDRGSEADLAAVAIAAQTAGVAVYAFTYSAFRTAFTTDTPVPRTKRSVDPAVPNPERTVDGMPSSPMDLKLISPDNSVDVVAGIGELIRLRKSEAASVLTTATGGTLWSFTRQKGLEEAIEKFGADLNTQYVLSFAPDAAEAGYHALSVRITRPGEFHIRARPGYWNAGVSP